MAFTLDQIVGVAMVCSSVAYGIAFILFEKEKVKNDVYKRETR